MRKILAFTETLVFNDAFELALPEGKARYGSATMVGAAGVKEQSMKAIDDAADSLGLDREEVCEFMADFLEIAREDVAALRSATREEHMAVIRSRAHSVKGAALNLSLREIGDTALELEDKAKSNDPSEMADLVERLAGQLEELSRQLTAYSESA